VKVTLTERGVEVVQPYRYTHLATQTLATFLPDHYARLCEAIGTPAERAATQALLAAFDALGPVSYTAEIARYGVVDQFGTAIAPGAFDTATF
jgi:hypothetical protein